MKPHFYLILLLLLHVSITWAVDFDQDIGGFLEEHCIRCHGDKKQKGDLRIDTLSKEVGTKDTGHWAEVMQKISSAEMPPEDEEKLPTAEAGAQVVEWLAARIKEGETARMAQRDRVSFYRLSREEYVHTIYDLFGVHFNAADPGGFTDDPEWHGFERIGSVLTLSRSNIEKYFDAAETILAEAYPEKPLSEKFSKRVPAVPNVSEPYKARLEEQGLLDKVRFDLWPQDKHNYSKPGRLPAPGVYEARFKLSGLQPADGRAPRLMVYHEKLDRVLFEQDVVAPEDAPASVSFKTHLPAGDQQIVVINDVPGPSNLPRSGRHGRKPFVSIKDGRIPWQLKLTDEEGQALYPFLILDEVTWEGPIITDEEQQLRADYYPQEEGNLDQVREGLNRLARRAFRRPLRDGEIDPFVKIVETEQAAGSNFKTAVKTAMLGILCSKSFLFITEGDEKADQRWLNDWELATRLSYFLWSTMPDAPLFALAESGTLHQPAILQNEVKRMLADPRAERFMSTFPSQWLQLHRVGMFTPDSKLYPDYDPHLEKSMLGESTSFFREVLLNNLTLREFIHSDWTMLNPRLALHYGLPPIQQDQFQKVSLRPDDHRGGLLTQASILSLSSDGQRPRPVHRGVWLSEVIFNQTPPPPPANVKPIEPNPVDAPKATLRMKLDAHKANPNCASCHRKIDPLGLAFDNYDAIGRWRTEEIVSTGTGANPPIDASGELPDGRTYANADEFKKLLLNDLDAFNRAFIEKLATYGLRRTVTFDDREDLEALAEKSKQADYQLRALVEAFVCSDLFKKR